MGFRQKCFAFGVSAVALLALAPFAIDADDPDAQSPLTALLINVIERLRDDAVEQGVAEVPGAVRDALADYIPPEVLATVRWRVDDSNLMSAANLFGNGTLTAVTLDHVIVFVSDDDAADLTLWAHELYHVRQYREWGVAGFVERYLEEPDAVERAAKEFRWQWMKATGRVPDIGR